MVMMACAGMASEAKRESGAKRKELLARWHVEVIEHPDWRWDGVASWVDRKSPVGAALGAMPGELAERLATVAFAEGPGPGGIGCAGWNADGISESDRAGAV